MSILKIRTSRRPLYVEGQRTGSVDSGLAMEKAKKRKELASIKDARKLFRLVERDRNRSQDKKLRILADVDTRLEAARADLNRISYSKQLMVSREHEDIRISLKIASQISEHARSLVDIDKRLKFAREEVKDALSAKISVLRQQQGEAKI